MAKKEKSRLIAAIDVLHKAYTGPPLEPERIEDVYQEADKRLERLSFGFASTTRRENALLAERLAARTDWMIFPDTNQLDVLGDDLWEALLEHRRHVALTARVVREIDGPLSRRTDHPLYRAVQDGVVLSRPDAPDGFHLFAQEYYIALIMAWRSVRSVLEWSAAMKAGEPPGDAEKARIRKMIDREVERDRIIIETKEAKRVACGKPLLCTDEHLVYHAISYALETGQPTMILSGDNDVASYFRHTIEMMLKHYRAMMIADRYADDPALFTLAQIPAEEAAGYFMPADDVQSIDLRHLRGHPRPTGESEPVAISCMTVTPHHVSELIFNAETGMYRVIRVKGETGGLNTDRLDGRNLYAWPALMGVPDRHGVIGRTVMVPVNPSGIQIPNLDLTESLMGIRRPPQPDRDRAVGLVSRAHRTDVR
jgi:hypothetical protein